MSALGEPLFRAIFTDKWLDSVPYFRILCWAGILYPIHAYNLNVLNVKGRSDLFLKLEIIKKVLSLIVIVATIPFGIYVMLYGGVFLSVLVFFINSYYTGIIIKYNFIEQFKDLIPAILIATLSAIIVFYCDRFMSQVHITDWKRLIIGTSVGLILYISISQIMRISALTELKSILRTKK
jgi:O-antigen/teichoic acid export membrane protein